MALSIMTLSIMTLSIMTLSIMTFSKKGLYVTLSKTDTQHNKALHYAECCYTEYHILFIVMLSVIMLSVILLNIVAPCNYICAAHDTKASMGRLSSSSEACTFVDNTAACCAHVNCP
jgi:hypothetical protein